MEHVSLQSIGVLFGMFVSVIGGVWVLGRLVNKKAYDNGVHSKEHALIKEDVESAHEMIRENQQAIRALEIINERNTAEHQSIIANVKRANDTTEKIYALLLKNNNGNGGFNGN